ncbi:hypothetical protein OHU23_40955 (plasmid) [Streptomyces virginiae]|uniref:hypothetical protein n=1 Tax=Streptomyces virginiae TaxID=1961 RepID=UPI002F916CED
MIRRLFRRCATAPGTVLAPEDQVVVRPLPDQQPDADPIALLTHPDTETALTGTLHGAWMTPHTHAGRDLPPGIDLSV